MFFLNDNFDNSREYLTTCSWPWPTTVQSLITIAIKMKKLYNGSLLEVIKLRSKIALATFYFIRSNWMKNTYKNSYLITEKCSVTINKIDLNNKTYFMMNNTTKFRVWNTNICSRAGARSRSLRDVLPGKYNYLLGT